MQAAEREKLCEPAEGEYYLEGESLHQCFEAQVERTPEAVCVVCEGGQLTYRELNRRANQVAHYLQALGVGAEVVVGLYMERSLEMVLGLLSILKAGGAYLPLDPAYPQERRHFMLKDSQASVLLTQERLTADLPDYNAPVVCLDAQWHSIAQESDLNPISGAMADNLAYVLYTSGSAGKPKGVLGIHRAALNALAWMWQTYPFINQEVCCQKTSISFGDSIQELLGPLLQGIRIVLIPDEALKDPPRFVQMLSAHRVTRILSVPSLLRVLLDTYADLGDRLPSLKLWFASGEILPRELWKRFQTCMPHSSLINIYGASEMSDDVTWYDTSLMDDESLSVAIGRPIANIQAYMLGGHLQPVPTGDPGELHVGGTGLVRGYLNRPELSAERFIPHPSSDEPGARLYKTGDLARYLPDSNLEYLGRLDHQVKIRGFRVELGEIEAVLGQHPTVQQAVVIAHEGVAGDTRLVAYIISRKDQASTVHELRRFLQAKLPEYMMPSAFVWLDALPLTPNGKMDRQALPAPDRARPALEDAFVAPSTLVEEELARIWVQVLGIEQVGIHDNFFELGGHSLLATQVMSRLRHRFQVELPLRTMFEAPTIAGLARTVARHQGTEGEEDELACLLAEVESLSEDETKQRLAKERGSGQ